ncbi:MAG: hypothetical protein L0228_12805 [Planctomycetes bacterium]|nr:hypothetical protein [Planctomycetota bacterium]
MKTIDIANTTGDVARLLDEARENDLVVRLSDGSEFLLIALDEFDQEVAKSRQNSRLMALLEARASQTTTFPLDEVKRRLQL